MKYIKVSDGIVCSIIYDADPLMPGIPANKRYPASYLSSLISVPDDTMVCEGQTMDDEGNWVFPEPPSVEENPEQPIDPGAGESQKTYAEKLAALEEENKQLTSKLDAAIQSNQMLEDCLVEMAEIVYA